MTEKFPAGLRPGDVEAGDEVVTLERPDAGCGVRIPAAHRAEAEDRLRLMLAVMPDGWECQMRRWKLDG